MDQKRRSLRATDSTWLPPHDRETEPRNSSGIYRDQNRGPQLFVLRRLGVIIGTTEIAEWGVVTDRKVSVLFSNAGQHVQAQAGDFVQAEVVGSQPSNEVKVK